MQFLLSYIFTSLVVSLVWSPVTKEPIVCDGSAGADSLIDDLGVGVVWQPQTKALFDIRVVDTDARSYHACTCHDVVYNTEGEKKHKYLLAC